MNGVSTDCNFGPGVPYSTKVVFYNTFGDNLGTTIFATWPLHDEVDGICFYFL